VTMTEVLSRREIEKEADDNISLGRLLRKDRAEEKKKAVEVILAADLRIPQKIEKIKEIDGKQGAEDIERVVQGAYLQVAHRQFIRVRDTVKAEQQSLPYLGFMLRERRRVREFGRRTHTLEARFLPPGVRISPELRDFFVQQLQSWAAEITPRLNLVTENGWLHLTPLQYNLVVLLKALADKILEFDFIHLSYRDRNLIDRLKRIESLFLMLHYRPEYLQSILDSVMTIYKKQGNREEEGRQSRSLAMRILSKDATLPSLYNCIVGLNMAKHRRFVTLEELMRPGLGQAVSTRDFNCTVAVRRRIDDYVHGSLESIKKLHSQLLEVRRLNGYLYYDEQGAVNAGHLRLLYNKKFSKRRGGFDADQANVLLFAQRLFEAFYGSFVSLLNGKVHIDGVGRTAVFSRAFYEMEMARLAVTIEKLKKGPFHFSNFPLSQYLQVKEARMGTIGRERELIQLIEEGIACLADLGKSLARVLGSSVGNINAQEEPLEPVIFRGKPYSLPFAERRILDRSYLGGKTVSEALSDAISQCFTLGMLFRDRFVYLVLGSENKYERELQSQVKLLKNLVDPGRYQELRAQYQ
jgi:hypothetical protein